MVQCQHVTWISRHNMIECRWWKQQSFVNAALLIDQFWPTFELQQLKQHICRMWCPTYCCPDAASLSSTDTYYSLKSELRGTALYVLYTQMCQHISSLISPEGHCPPNRKRSVGDNLRHRKWPHWMQIIVECCSCIDSASTSALNVFYITFYRSCAIWQRGWSRSYNVVNLLLKWTLRMFKSVLFMWRCLFTIVLICSVSDPVIWLTNLIEMVQLLLPPWINSKTANYCLCLLSLRCSLTLLLFPFWQTFPYWSQTETRLSSFVW